LAGGLGVGLEIDRRFLGLDEKLSIAADAKGIVRGLGFATDFDGVFVNDILVGLGITLGVAHIPAECSEKRIEKLEAEACFLIILNSAVGDEELEFSGS